MLGKKYGLFFSVVSHSEPQFGRGSQLILQWSEKCSGRGKVQGPPLNNDNNHMELQLDMQFKLSSLGLQTHLFI